MITPRRRTTKTASSDATLRTGYHAPRRSSQRRTSSRSQAPECREVPDIHEASLQSRDACPREPAQLPVGGLAAQAGERGDELLTDFEAGSGRRGGGTGQTVEQQQDGVRHPAEGIAQREHAETVE